MKRLYTLTLLALACFSTLSAEVVDNYNAPTNFQAYRGDNATIFWFTAPVEGGVVWHSSFSYDNGMGDMHQLSDGDAWGNAGSGAELSTSAAIGVPFTNHASTLVTPALTLEAGCSYELSYKSAGSRKTSNQKLTVVLYHGEDAQATLVEEYELSPSLAYDTHTAHFSVAESGDYEVRFAFTESEKTCGVSLRDIVLTAPIPEGRGALLGYNLYRNDEMVRYYQAAEAQQNQLYLELTDDAPLAYATTYTFALQAVYEGGESPLSATASFTTGEDPLVGVQQVGLQSSALRYDLSGRRSAQRGLGIENQRKTLR